MRPVHSWLVFALVGEPVLLLLLDGYAGLGLAAWLVGLAGALGVVLMLGRGLARQPTPTPGTTPGATLGAALGPANRVTLTRAVLACGVAGLVVQSFATSSSTTAPTTRIAITVIAAVAMLLDAVDGRVARRTSSTSELGARFDLETDAFLLLVLSGYVAQTVGWWVLAIGLARYLLLAASWMLPWLRGPLPPRYWRKVVAAFQAIALLIATSGLLPGTATTLLLAVALALLVQSFGGEVLERRRGAVDRGTAPVRSSTWVARTISLLAVGSVWLALVAPGSGHDLSVWALARIPVEGLVLVTVVLFLPARWGRRLALGFGFVAAMLLVLKALNVGFSVVLDRSFSLLGDWRYLGSAVGVLADSIGRTRAVGVAVLTGVLVVALLVVLPLATIRTCRLARSHRRQAGPLVASVGALAVLLAVTGLQPTPGVGAVSASSAGLAVEEVRGLSADLRDQAVFADQISTDPLAGTPTDRLLGALRGKDVLLVFVESYGRVAIQDSSFAPGVDAVLDHGTRDLRRAGYRSRSAFLTSPTFGAGSWLAHSTLQSGLWVDSQRRYDQLLAAQRLTLSEAFRSAGWRTVSDVPSDTRDWPEGARFYHFDSLYDARNVGYQGPEFGYATMPDQYTLSRFRERELAPANRRPVMAEIDLVSSHHPWAPLPHLVPWSQVGDGSVFDGMPEQGDSPEEVFADPDRVRAAYGQSIQYTWQTLVSYLTTFADDNLVVIAVGDHQPHHYVSGADPGHDVPISLISRDPKVLDQISGWHWQPGLRPAPDAPVWRMDAFRDRFLTSFATPG